MSIVGWTSASRIGSFSRYLQVHFGNLTRVTAVRLEHPLYVASAVQQYQVHYSNDGINWIAACTVSARHVTSRFSPNYVMLRQ